MENKKVKIGDLKDLPVQSDELDDEKLLGSVRFFYLAAIMQIYIENRQTFDVDSYLKVMTVRVIRDQSGPGFTVRTNIPQMIEDILGIKQEDAHQILGKKVDEMMAFYSSSEK